ncbi:pyridine nucleotide-disulfide oxidoreductase domain-containing protein 1 isoform X1 [Hydra vulgaris]|uniref:Pyridine nucleotide-disulfide oxidoreductase domain-containing protein 1 isoform X1 n=1 Tax=Hydra vulgaris TaxID=6087 RepID=A0ABM4CXM6_HYDVU
MAKTVVIIGGGVTGTSCAEHVSIYSPDANIVLLAATDVVKTAVSLRKLTKTTDELVLKELPKLLFESPLLNVTVKTGVVDSINAEVQEITLNDGLKLHYDKLCICTGGSPNVSYELMNHPFVVLVRDTDTVKIFEQRLSNAKKIVVVGNGGIALELVFEVVKCKIVWCVKHDHIGTNFFDKGASEFLLPILEQNYVDKECPVRKADTLISKEKRYFVERYKLADSHTITGSALGPDWCLNKNLCGNLTSEKRNVEIKYNCQVAEILPSTFNILNSKKKNVYVKLSNGEIIGCDFIVYATGVKPNVPKIHTKVHQIKCSPEGHLLVDANMRTSIPNIYAGGDCCQASWDQSTYWFQMNLWTQAWQFGAFAGKCIANHLKVNLDLPLDFCFELFTHATKFFGYKVILLGCYNAQKIDKNSCELLVRCTPGIEYVKLVMLNGRVQGATLIGETGLEETIENLIINEIDVGFMGTSLLDPDIDIEDYFD